MFRVALTSLVALLLCAGNAEPQDIKPHIADAKREHATLFSHPDNPCPTQNTTRSYEICIQKQVDFTETHLAAFFADLHAMAVIDDTAPSPSEAYGPRRETQLLDAADVAWRVYKKNLCGLQAASVGGGTGQASVEMECIYRTDRQYARQLADAFLLQILAS